METVMEVFLNSKSGEDYCGDRFLAIPRSKDTLYALIDGIGHGVEASLAADSAVYCITAMLDDPLLDICAASEDALRDTRGAAISLVTLTHDTQCLEYVSIGNIESYIIGHNDFIQLNKLPGIFGATRRQFKINSLQIPADATLLMCTDGVGVISQYILRQFNKMSPRHIVNLLSQRWRGNDDICILCEDLNHGTY